MASTKSKKTRKGLAVGLAVLGVAGLSLASASQLNLGSSVKAVQTGAVTVDSSCQATTIAVAFADPAQTTGTYSSSKVTFNKIDTLCQGKKYRAAFTSVTGGLTTYAETTPDQTLPATITSANQILSVDLPAGVIADNVTKIALTIY